MREAELWSKVILQQETHLTHTCLQTMLAPFKEKAVSRILTADRIPNGVVSTVSVSEHYGTSELYTMESIKPIYPLGDTPKSS